MRYAVFAPNLGGYSDPRTLAELAVLAEEYGWEGFFLFDHILPTEQGEPLSDPWVTLGAIAAKTSRIRIGTLVTPLPRRRPWKLARETVTLDRLSGGRLTLGVGLGGPPEREFETFGEAGDLATRGRMLDEGLRVLEGLWSGESFSIEGEFYRVNDAVFQPTPVQSPRIPVWVGAKWRNKAPLRRATRWDGVVPIPHDGEAVTPDALESVVSYVASHRRATSAFDVALADHDGDRRKGALQDYADAGLTWWIQRIHPPWAGSLAEARDLVRQGPPKGPR